MNLGRVAEIVEVNVGVKATPPEMKKSEFRVAEIVEGNVEVKASPPEMKKLEFRVAKIVEGNLKVKVSFQFKIWEKIIYLIVSIHFIFSLITNFLRVINIITFMSGNYVKVLKEFH